MVDVCSTVESLFVNNTHSVTIKFRDYASEIETTAETFSKVGEIVMTSILTIHTQFPNNWFIRFDTATFCTRMVVQGN